MTRDVARAVCVSGAEGERVDHRGVRFELDMLGLDIWRWTIHPPVSQGLRIIGQFRGKRDAAVEHCKRAIDDTLDGNSSPA